jgi:hypothetical protein
MTARQTPTTVHPPHLPVDLIVARYNEDLNWLRRVPRGARVFVYDKGATPGPSAIGKHRTLNNAGREAHTYLHHIVEHYNDLAEVNVFVQGKPFDHAPDLHRFLRGLAAGTERVEGFRWLGFLVDRDDRTGSRLFQTWSKNPERRPLAMEEFWRVVFADEPCPAEFVFFGGAQFAVTREAVRARPPSWYENALAASTGLPDAAHCFERVWDKVFRARGIPQELRERSLPVYLKPIRRLMEK